MRVCTCAWVHMCVCVCMPVGRNEQKFWKQRASRCPTFSQTGNKGEGEEPGVCGCHACDGAWLGCWPAGGGGQEPPWNCVPHSLQQAPFKRDGAEELLEHSQGSAFAAWLLLPAPWAWASCLTSLSLSFPTCKMGRQQSPSHRCG